MFAKIATVIIVLGAMFGALLVNRQKRIDAAAEISRSHFRMLQHDRARTRLQAQVAAAVRPDRLRDKLEQVDEGKFKPIPNRYDPQNGEGASGGGLLVGEPVVGSRDERYGG
ncbi:MAG: hypothetical protein LW636_02260 [Planctomycetaceae bacterium]|nr:hypothetical protein [Planctomycetaceae bacterium]